MVRQPETGSGRYWTNWNGRLTPTRGLAMKNQSRANKPGERICEPSAGSKYAPADGSQED